MPKIGKTTIRNPKAHYREVAMLFQLIADRHNKTRGDVVIAYERDISVYNARQWLVRPIPKKHWAALAKLSGLPLADIEKIAL